MTNKFQNQAMAGTKIELQDETRIVDMKLFKGTLKEFNELPWEKREEILEAGFGK
jgi:hypothetical protein